MSKETHSYADGWMNAVAYVEDKHPNVEPFEVHLMGCATCQELVDLARIIVLGEQPACNPSLIAWYVLAVLMNRELRSVSSAEPLAWIHA